jgi:hypothetical protein
MEDAGVVMVMAMTTTGRREGSSTGTTLVTADGTVAARGSDWETGETASETGGTATDGAAEGATVGGDTISRVVDVSDRFA